MRLRDNWADGQQVVLPLRMRVKTCLSLIQRTRQNVCNTSDKARLVSVSEFDLYQTCSSRQHDKRENGPCMLQCDECGRYV